MKRHLGIKVAIFITYFFFAILLNSTGVVILLVQSFFDVSESAASVLDPYKDLSIALASFIAGIFVTRIGIKRAIQIALLVTVIAAFSVPFVKTFTAVKLMAAVGGFSFGICKVAIFSTLGLITDSTKEHMSLMSFLEGVFMIGILFGYILFSYLSIDVMSGTWLYSYVIMGILALLSLISISMSSLDESLMYKDATHTTGSDLKVMFGLLVIPVVLIFLTCAFLNVLIEQSTMNWLPTFNKKVVGLPESLAIIMASILSASMAVGRLIAGVVLKYVSWIKVIIGCLICAAVVLVVSLEMAKGIPVGFQVNNLSEAPLVAFIFPLIGLFLSPVYPAINSLILDALPNSKHAQMSSLIVLFSAIGGSAGSVITGVLFEHTGGIQAFYYSLIPISLLIIMLYLFKMRILKFKHHE